MSYKTRTDYNLHVHTKAALKVRDIAEKTGMTNAQIVDQLINFACQHVRLVPKAKYDLVFSEPGERSGNL